MFYRDLFAALCFIVFGAALAFKHPYLFFAAMMLACFSRTAARKQWPNPGWVERYFEKWYGTEPEDSEEEE